jgi:hypothetical protein
VKDLKARLGGLSRIRRGAGWDLLRHLCCLKMAIKQM